MVKKVNKPLTEQQKLIRWGLAFIAFAALLFGLWLFSMGGWWLVVIASGVILFVSCLIIGVILIATALS